MTDHQLGLHRLPLEIPITQRILRYGSPARVVRRGPRAAHPPRCSLSRSGRCISCPSEFCSDRSGVWLV